MKDLSEFLLKEPTVGVPFYGFVKTETSLQSLAIVPNRKSNNYDLLNLKKGEVVKNGTLEEISDYPGIRKKFSRLINYDEIDKFADLIAEEKAKQIMSQYVEYVFSKEVSTSYSVLSRKIINRFTDIGIVKPDNTKTQFMKVTEELGELAEGINKDKPEQVKDSLGDVLVTLILLAEDLNLNLLDCLNSAWNEIKNRKGEVKDGSFVKEEDLNV
ncbi:MazG-like family protein [Ligilactobacillus agilis]|uniref:MazG-like family protein n=1 Tax=Ligilactobacillus agilis TaxID=1601 RepID=UPI000B8E3A94|nr:MazG-like family protein [Ligilactobacillus agilis]